MFSTLNVWQKEMSRQSLAFFSESDLSYPDLLSLQRKLPVIFPWESQYASLRIVSNRQFSFFPMAIVVCKFAIHVQAAVKWCKTHKFEFAVRTTGHGFLPFCLSNQIVIDVSQLCKVRMIATSEESKQVSTKFQRASTFVLVGPGASMISIAEILSERNLALPLSSCPSLSVCGLALGAGISPNLMRLSGLLCDFLYCVKIVVADGTIKRIYGIHHPKHGQEDKLMLWALRGAGGCNFGIVVSLTFQPCHFRGAIVFQVFFPWTAFDKVVTAWQDLAPFWDPRLSCELSLRSPKYHSQNAIEFKGQFEGSDKDELGKVLLPFLRKFENIQSQIHIVTTFADCARFWTSAAEHKSCHFSGNSIFWQKTLSKQTMQVYKSFLEKAPGALDIVTFTAMMGNIPRFTESAFPWRQSLFWAFHQGRTLKAKDFKKHEVWVHDLYFRVSPGAAVNLEETKTRTIPAYVNIPQTNLADRFQYMHSYYGENAPQLLKCKRKFDPENIFHFAQSIPTLAKKEGKIST